MAQLIPTYFDQRYVPFQNLDFSFRTDVGSAKMSHINILPSSLNVQAGNMVKDISFGITMKGGEEVSIQNILNTVPYIYVRQYRLSPILNDIANGLATIYEGFKKGKSIVEEGVDLEALGKEGCELVRQLMSLDSMKEVFKDSVSEKWISTPQRSSDDSFFLNIPFILYYRIIGTTNIGLYEFPYSDKLIDGSDGTQGWQSQLQGLFKKLDQLQSVGINLKSPVMPMWNADNEKGQQIQTQFFLFNDSAEAAANNYMFITKLATSNRSVQWGLLQHNPPTYDITIPSVGRYFMCSAKIDIKQAGVMRRISKKILDNLKRADESRPFNADITSQFLDEVGNAYNGGTDYVFAENLLIPDVYQVDVTFESLLPNNMNNAMLKYVLTNSIDDTDNIVKTISDNMSKQVNKIVGANKSTMPILNKIMGGTNGTSSDTSQPPDEFMMD